MGAIDPGDFESGSSDMGAMALRVMDEAAGQLPLALDLPPDTPFVEWLAIGRRLHIGSQAVNWHIGDWWRHGIQHYGEERTRDAAQEIWGVESETARVYGWVAEKFDPVNRLTDLSFTHYQRVAGLPSDQAMPLLHLAAEKHLSVRALHREVQAVKASNDAAPSAPQPVATTRAVPKPNRTELEECYARYVEAMEALEAFRELTKRETDFLAVALNHLGEAHAERRPVPDDFEVVFVEQGRLACEAWYRASRITINRWLLQSGKTRLIERRAEFVKHQRGLAHPAETKGGAPSDRADPLYPVARLAADHLRMSRYGGWRISQCQDGNGWFVGTVRKSSDELIAMAERQGFDRAAAAAEAKAEGY